MYRWFDLTAYAALAACVSCGGAKEGPAGTSSGTARASGSAQAEAPKAKAEVVALAAGSYHQCAVLATGKVKCWGAEGDFRLGAIQTSSKGIENQEPLEVTGLEGVKAVAPGDRHSCALLASGGVVCWGGDTIATATGKDDIGGKHKEVPGLAGVVSVATGYSVSCAVLKDATVSCWGTNKYQALGPDAGTESATPVKLAGLSDVTAVDIGPFGACALLKDGKVKCWGAVGPAGSGESERGLKQIAGLADVKDIAVGFSHYCAALGDGSVRCWGKNDDGELGNGSFEDQKAPVAVEGIADAVAVDVGMDHSCALSKDGKVRCWGSNQMGVLDAKPGSVDKSNKPIEVEGVRAKLVSVGDDSTCVLSVDGDVSCWGNPRYGKNMVGEEIKPGLVKQSL